MIYKYVVGAIIILALLILLQRGCQSGAERRWERKQEKHQWRQDKKDDRRDDRGWRGKPDDQSPEEDDDGPERQWRFFRRRSSIEQSE